MNRITYQTFLPDDNFPNGLIMGDQTHSTNIVKVSTGKEDLTDTDGLITENPKLLLAVRTADCAPIVFIGKQRFGILHAGWRGLVDGIIEKMLVEFDESPKIWIGPLYPAFEIKRDDCLERIAAKYGDRFYSQHKSGIEFRFLDAIQSILTHAEFCGISTYDNPTYASWRREQNRDRRNITVVGELADSLPYLRS